ncbi:hypothetical protein H9Q70_000043 [Fusarium xylarioides]|nr:hypothetical protein H9Q70_000043 [Fusarium xylarioides]KAG5785941.1 hypothetical protein H9Q73_000379 [Fusarium xylarioides]
MPLSKRPAPSASNPPPVWRYVGAQQTTMPKRSRLQVKPPDDSQSTPDPINTTALTSLLVNLPNILEKVARKPMKTAGPQALRPLRQETSPPERSLLDRIRDLEREVSSLRQEVADKETEITNLKGEVASLKAADPQTERKAAF